MSNLTIKHSVVTLTLTARQCAVIAGGLELAAENAPEDESHLLRALVDMFRSAAVAAICQLCLPAPAWDAIREELDAIGLDASSLQNTPT